MTAQSHVIALAANRSVADTLALLDHGSEAASAVRISTALVIKNLEAIIENDDVEYGYELEEGQVTGERPDLLDREVFVPVEWLRQIVAELQAAA